MPFHSIPFPSLSCPTSPLPSILNPQTNTSPQGRRQASTRLRSRTRSDITFSSRSSRWHLKLSRVFFLSIFDCVAAFRNTPHLLHHFYAFEQVFIGYVSFFPSSRYDTMRCDAMRYNEITLTGRWLSISLMDDAKFRISYNGRFSACVHEFDFGCLIWD